MYWEKPVFEYSPSLGMSMPHSACIRTASATCRARMVRSASLNSVPSSLRCRISTISGGRTRLPTWVVRMRRLLRFTGLSPVRHAENDPAQGLCGGAEVDGLHHVHLGVGTNRTEQACRWSHSRRSVLAVPTSRDGPHNSVSCGRSGTAPPRSLT